MTNWLVWGVLMLASYSKASAFSGDFNDKIKEGLKNITATATAVQKEAGKVSQAMNQVSLNFSLAVNQSMVAGERMYNSSALKVEKIIMANFEEAIDSNKDTRILLYILETTENVQGELGGRYENLRAKLTEVLAQKSSELLKLRNLFDFTQTFSTGFYGGLKAGMTNCKDDKCIAQLIQAAQKKEKSLSGIFDKYKKAMSNMRVGLQDGHRDCMRDAQKGFSEVLKKLENDMEYFPGKPRTDELGDNLYSAILEW